MASANTIWCSILKDSKLRELFSIEKFSSEKDSGKVTLIIIYIVLIIITIIEYIIKRAVDERTVINSLGRFL